MSREFWEGFIETVGAVIVVGGLSWLSFLAFREKFPHAAWWAWFFN